MVPFNNCCHSILLIAIWPLLSPVAAYGQVSALDAAPISPILKVGMSADGELAFSGDAAGTIRVWYVPTRRLLQRIEDKSKNRNAVPHYDFSADGKYAIVGYTKPRRELMGDLGQEGLPKLKGPIVLDPDTLRLIDLDTGTKRRSFQAEGQPIRRVAISPNGQWLLTLKEYKEIQYKDHESVQRSYSLRELCLWNVYTGQLVRTLLKEEGLDEPNRIFNNFSFTPRGELIAAHTTGKVINEYRNRDKELKLWQTNNGALLPSKMVGISPAISFFAFSQNNKIVATSAGTGISLQDFPSGKVIWSVQQAAFGQWSIDTLSYSSNGQYILAAGANGWIDGSAPGKNGGLLVLEAANGHRKLETTSDWMIAACFSPDNNWIVGGTAQGVQFWDLKSGQKAFLLAD